MRYYLIAFVHWFASFFLERDFFVTSSLEVWPVAVIKLIVLVVFWQAIRYLVHKYRTESHYRHWLNFTMLYFALNMFVLLLVWPGNWGQDDLRLVVSTQNFTIWTWQHYLMQLFYYIGVFIYPTPVSVVILQLACLSLIVGYFIYELSKALGDSKLAWLSYLPFLLPPVLTQNIYPLRATLFSYLILFLITRFLVLWQRNKPLDFIGFTSILLPAILITALRGEGVYYIIAAPLLFFIVFKHTSTSALKVIFVAALLGGSFLLHIPQKLLTSPEKQVEYELTIYLAPLGHLFVEAEKEGLTEIIDEIGYYLDLDILRANPSSSAYFVGGLLKETFYTEDGPNHLKKILAQLIKRYPKAFLSERWGEFLSSSLPDASITGVGGSVGESYYEEAFKDTPSAYLSQSTRSKTLTTLQLGNSQILHALIHNIMLPLGLLIYTSISLAIRRKWVPALIVAIALPMTILVFFGSPVSYFMYYLPYYLTGYVFAFSALLLSLKTKK